MFVPVYQWLSNDSVIAAAVGSRIFNGLAPRDAVLPYIVLTDAGMSPEIFLGCRQNLDYDRVSVHVWHRNQSLAKSLAAQAREVVGAHATIVGGIIDDEDVPTGSFRCGFDIGDWTEL